MPRLPRSPFSPYDLDKDEEREPSIYAYSRPVSAETRAERRAVLFGSAFTRELPVTDPAALTAECDEAYREWAEYGCGGEEG